MEKAKKKVEEKELFELSSARGRVGKAKFHHIDSYIDDVLEGTQKQKQNFLTTDRWWKTAFGRPMSHTTATVSKNADSKKN